jgi:hypothetical protein
MKVRSIYVLLLVLATLSFSQPQRILAQSTPPPPTPQVRMKWQDFIKGSDGAKRLASLKKAIARMRSLDGAPKTSMDYRRSWEYWANIHGYYGPASMDGAVEEQIQYLQSNGLGQYVSYYTGIVDQTPPDADAAKVWATCQHSYQDQNGNMVQANFWGWHRMYLYYFERVLRWAAGDDTLRLPYWDYTDPIYTALPAQFRNVRSVLYDEKRNPIVNTGTPLDPSTTNINPVLNIANYLNAELTLEMGVHGNVHCETAVTCPVAHMGDVPVAGNDPIFYAHHANIDRVWACWQKIYPPVPDAPWQDQEFSFPDETGNLQTKPVKSFLSTAAVGYVYDHEESCARPGGLHVSPAELAVSQEPPVLEQSFPQIVASKSSIVLSPSTTTVDIAVAWPSLLQSNPQAPTPSTLLVLRNITAQSPPGEILKVYVASKEHPDKKIQVAAISWFNAFGHHSTGPSVRTLSYDVTDELRQLGVTSGTSALTVSFEAATGLVTPRAAAAAQALFRPEARLTIGAVEFRQPSAPQ